VRDELSARSAATLANANPVSKGDCRRGQDGGTARGPADIVLVRGGSELAAAGGQCRGRSRDVFHPFGDVRFVVGSLAGNVEPRRLDNAPAVTRLACRELHGDAIRKLHPVHA
jgi:hypothetical protein